MSFPRYRQYKDSGLEWLGEVPEGWTVLPIRFAARLESGHTPSRLHPEYWENCTVPWFTLADVWQIRQAGRKYILETEEKVSALGLANSAARLLPKGTVMLSRTASVGFSAIMGVDMATTQDFANWVCGPELHPEFLLYVFKSMSGEFRRLMMGSTHNTIYMPDIQSLRFALPPLPDQRKIVGALDVETKKIDELVAEQRRLMELLKEKRQAVISHAVTKGLNPRAPMKPSGIEWLGDVPGHWNVTRIKKLASVISKGTTPTTVGAEFTDEGVRFLKAENVTERGVSAEPEFFISERSHEMLSRSSLQRGDVLVVIAGATTGKSAVLGASLLPANTNQAVSFIRPRDRRHSEHLNYWLGTPAVRSLIGLASVQSAQPNLSMEDLGNIPLPLPPPQELEGIQGFLTKESGQLDALAAEAQKAIDLLQERRTALISAAVTGQIDVRKLAAA